MKKYIVTENHPAYKAGLEIINGALILSDTDDWGGIYPETIEDWLERGWIKEVQEPEFTEDQMISILMYYNVNNNNHYPKMTEEGCRNWFDAWINFRENESK